MVVVLASCGDYASVWDSASLSSGASYAEIVDSQSLCIMHQSIQTLKYYSNLNKVTDVHSLWEDDRV
ncbi:hypothetical protein Hamer_G026110 [Homarus americanus]|uniref:Uncharacterized protein n=1 Tax=Homarus americanus TaxID=6706 RepID=A0A8J5NBK2_HOMAM|nr:hypothetical protein Hamer_G026110 [Homarus americanus]